MRTCLTTVRVAVQDVLIRANITPWRCLVAHMENLTAQNAHLIWKGKRFEPHLLAGVILLVLLEDAREEGGQEFAIGAPRQQIGQVFGKIARVWLIQRIVADYVIVVGEKARNDVPIVHKFVL